MSFFATGNLGSTIAMGVKNALSTNIQGTSSIVSGKPSFWTGVWTTIKKAGGVALGIFGQQLATGIAGKGGTIEQQGERVVTQAGDNLIKKYAPWLVAGGVALYFLTKKGRR